MHREYLLISNSYDEKTGIGRHTKSFQNFLIDKKKKHKLLTILDLNIISNIKNRFLQNTLFFFISSFLIRSKKKYFKISFSTIAPLSCDLIQFSSCHLYSLKHVGNLFFLKILFPQNIFYVLIEFLHYRNPNSTNSFLSEIEVERFKKVYGNTTAKCVVIYPRIHKKLLSAKHKTNFSIQNSECIKCIFIAYNPLLKGFDVIEELTELNPKLKFFIFGKDNLNVNNKNIINMGKVPLNEIDFSKYDLFIYPSKLDSYAFVLEESLRMNLIPFFTKEVGCGEIFSFTNTRHSLLINSKNSKLTNDRINDVISSVNKSSILISKLEELRNKLENEDYIDYFEGKLKKINKSF